VTDAVLETVAEWQNRPREPMYPLAFFEALRVKIRDEGSFATRSSMSSLASGRKEPRTFWAFGSRPRKALKFWLRVMSELKNRGVEDIPVAVVNGLKGFPEAIAAVFPPTIVRTCIVHLIRNSMDFASWKDRIPTAAELKGIYRPTTRTWPADAGGFRRLRLGPQVFGNRAEPAAQLGACHPVLRLSRRGSLRVFAQSSNVGKQLIAPAVSQMIDLELSAGGADSKYYRQFRGRAERVKDHAVSFLIDAKRNGHQVGAMAPRRKATPFSTSEASVPTLALRG
jgi:hypothetical protein